MKSYNTEENEKVPIIMNWLGHEGLRFVHVLTDNEGENCETSTELLEVLSEKFKPHHNQTILSLQKCQLVQEEKC